MMAMLTLHNLKTVKGAKKRKRRVGRGNASGKGNYSGRGLKGQKARSGGKRKMALRSVKTYLQRIPKVKGFKSHKPKLELVNLTTLDKFFNNQDEITPVILLKRGLIKTNRFGVKILGNGNLTKKLIVKANQFSKSAKNGIISAGGQAEVIKKYKRKEANKNRK